MGSKIEYCYAGKRATLGDWENSGERRRNDPDDNKVNSFRLLVSGDVDGRRMQVQDIGRFLLTLLKSEEWEVVLKGN